MSGGPDRKGRPREGKERMCPICGKPAEPEHLPFCSRRCANVDLNRWLSGTYAIPGQAAGGSDEREDEN